MKEERKHGEESKRNEKGSGRRKAKEKNGHKEDGEEWGRARRKDGVKGKGGREVGKKERRVKTKRKG